MFNSVTNAMHATALGIYTYLVYLALKAKEPHYTISIFLLFLLTFMLKILGVIVHLPRVENNKTYHDFFWILIALFIIILSVVTLQAIAVSAILWTLGVLLSAIFSLIFIRTLFTGHGDFHWLALSMAILTLICMAETEGVLRLAWSCILLSNLLWLILAKVPFLLKHKFHNDIYHLALIGSTYLLYATIPSGLW